MLFFAPGAVAFSSQCVPIHSPLISSIVDFVCSSDQTAQELIFFHRLESPTVWTVCQVFPLWEVVLCPTLVCCYQSPQIGCVFCYCQFCQFCQHSFLLSVWVCIVCVPPRCFQLFEQRRFILVVQFCNLCRQFFVFSGSVFRCHSCLLWRLLQWVHPLEHWRWILALLQACDLLICFEDTSGPQLLTTTTLFRVQSCVDFWLQQIFPALSLCEFHFGSLLFLRGFFIAASLICSYHSGNSFTARSHHPSLPIVRTN
jgi:hypothetical protein